VEQPNETAGPQCRQPVKEKKLEWHNKEEAPMA